MAFYPKNNTPLCTKEVCSFRDRIPEFQKKDVLLLGISTNKIASHQRFAEKKKLSSLVLLADQTGEVSDRYGVSTGLWSLFFPNRSYGLRTLFLIKGKDRKIIKIVEGMPDNTKLLNFLELALDGSSS